MLLRWAMWPKGLLLIYGSMPWLCTCLTWNCISPGMSIQIQDDRPEWIEKFFHGYFFLIVADDTLWHENNASTRIWHDRRAMNANSPSCTVTHTTTHGMRVPNPRMCDPNGVYTRLSGDWLIDYLRFYVPLKNISLTCIWRRHHCRWRAAKLILCLALGAFEQGGIFIVPHLL
jgi:hypothetical protein